MERLSTHLDLLWDLLDRHLEMKLTCLPSVFSEVARNRHYQAHSAAQRWNLVHGLEACLQGFAFDFEPVASLENAGIASPARRTHPWTGRETSKFVKMTIFDGPGCAFRENLAWAVGKEALGPFSVVLGEAGRPACVAVRRRHQYSIRGIAQVIVEGACPWLYSGVVAEVPRLSGMIVTRYNVERPPFPYACTFCSGRRRVFRHLILSSLSSLRETTYGTGYLRVCEVVVHRQTMEEARHHSSRSRILEVVVVHSFPLALVV